MSLSTFLSLYAISVPIFFVVDMLWLGVIARDFYQSRIGHLMEVNWTAAIIFYLIFLIGLTIFAMYPAVTAESGWQTAALWGGLFGFFTYATYEMTNLATLRGWPLDMAIVDMIWGAVLGALVSGLTVLLYGLIA